MIDYLNKTHNLRLKNPKKFNETVLTSVLNLFPYSKKKQEIVNTKISILKALDKKYQNFSMMHPLRVMFYSTMFFKKDLNLILLSMFHNLFEIKKIQKIRYKKLLGKKLSNEINVLTMNKEKKFNDAYIKKYYKRLYKSSKNVKMVKCLDKFDNLYNLYKNSNTSVKIKYLDEINKFIMPLAKKNKCLKKYLNKLVKRNYSLIKGYV